MLFKNIKSFFMKEDFDFDKPIISLYEFHPQMRPCQILNGIFFNNQDSILRLIPLGFNTIIGIIALCLEITFVIHGLHVKDYFFATECFSYLICAGTIPLVSISVFYNKDNILGLLDHMNSHFISISQLEPKHRDVFFSGQLLIWQLCIAWGCFTVFITSLYCANTFTLLLYQSLFTTQDENTIRPLIFPAWLPHLDPYKTPNYELLLMVEVLALMVILETFGIYVYVLFHYLLHYYYIMEMILIDFQSLFDGLDESTASLPRRDLRRMRTQGILMSRISRIIHWHNDIFNSINKISIVYGPPLVYQVMLSPLGICLMAYQVVEQLENGKFDVFFVLLLMATIAQLWIPCYLGTLLQEKAFEVGYACWNCGWETTKLSLLVRQDIITVIMRAQLPVTIKFIGLPPLTLETYSKMLRSSYSYFNILRQST